MTNEERDLITRFIERVGGPAASGGFASVPATTGQSLPPVDPEADSLLADLFQKHPQARYRITQLAVVQEQALAQASQRMQAMQAELQRQQQAAPPAGGSPWGQAGQPQSQGAPPPQSRGFFGSLFGGGQSAPRQAAPQYAPQPGYGGAGYGGAGYGGPGMFQPQGSGFLGGALQTAAGVAGGVVAAEALTSLFSGHHDGGGGFFGGASSPEMAYVPETAAAAPWGGAGGGPDPLDQGGAAKDFDQSSGWTPTADTSQGQGAGGQDTGWQDTSSQDNQDSGWSDGGGGGDSGWTDSSSDA